MPVNFYYTQRVRGFQQESEKYTGESATFHLRRTQHRCPRCGSTAVVATPLRRRSIRGEPLGSCREAKSDTIFVKFYGKYSFEFTMTAEQTSAFKEIIALYNSL